MKTKLLLLIFFIGFNFHHANCQVIKYCDPDLIDELEDFQLKDGMFIKSFSISLPRYSNIKHFPSDSLSIKLAGKSTYWIVLVSSHKKMGKAKMSMYDSTNTLVLALVNVNAEVISAAQIKTEEPMFYYFKVSFEKGYEGCAGIAIYYMPGYKIKNKTKQ
jgi:hypothetical protein